MKVPTALASLFVALIAGVAVAAPIGAEPSDTPSGGMQLGPSGTAARPATASPAEDVEEPSPDHPELVWGYDDTPPSSDWVRPALNVVTTDPAYGTSLRRVTDATGTRFDRNTYSRRQAENADGSYFLTYHGTATYRVYDRASTDLVSVTDIHPNGEPQWHPTNPKLIRYVGGNNADVGDLRLYETNVVTGRTRAIADLTDRLRAQLPGSAYMIDRAEGSPSIDGNRYAWIVYDDSGAPIGIVSYDLGGDEILGVINGVSEDQLGLLDWISMSPTGSHVLAGYGGGTLVYDPELSNRRRVNDKADHSDIALDTNGNDAYVYIDFSSGPDAGFLVSVDLATLDRTRIFEVYGGANTSVHVSGKGFGKPGWVLVSTYNCKDPGAWTCHKVMAVEMVEGGRVLNLAHTYNCGDNYWTETHAVVNRDFTRAYFNTDSGSCGIDAEVIELTIPSFD